MKFLARLRIETTIAQEVFHVGYGSDPKDINLDKYLPELQGADNSTTSYTALWGKRSQRTFTDNRASCSKIEVVGLCHYSDRAHFRSLTPWGTLD